MLFAFLGGVLAGISLILLSEFLYGGGVRCLCCAATSSLKIKGTHEYGFYLECKNCGAQYESSKKADECKEDHNEEIEENMEEDNLLS